MRADLGFNLTIFLPDVCVGGKCTIIVRFDVVTFGKGNARGAARMCCLLDNVPKIEGVATLA